MNNWSSSKWGLLQEPHKSLCCLHLWIMLSSADSFSRSSDDLSKVAISQSKMLRNVYPVKNCKVSICRLQRKFFDCSSYARNSRYVVAKWMPMRLWCAPSIHILGESDYAADLLKRVSYTIIPSIICFWFWLWLYLYF